MTDTIRVGVADDHPMFRAGVVSALRDVADIEMMVTDEAVDCTIDPIHPPLMSSGYFVTVDDPTF